MSVATEVLLKRYPEHLVRNVRQNLGRDAEDTSGDAAILLLSRDEFFDRVCNWDGLIGYGDQIRSWVEYVYGVDLSNLDEWKKEVVEQWTRSIVLED